MPSPNTITADKAFRLLGTPKAPCFIDIREDADFAREPFLIPGAVKRPHTNIEGWGARYRGRAAIVIGNAGQSLAEGTAARLRLLGVAAEVLENGFQSWRNSGLPIVPIGKLPPRDAEGRTIWVTRARPKIDRIACPWLIRRFVDPEALFFYVAAAEVIPVAEKFGGVPFDIEDVFWSHRAEFCTFDVMVEELGLTLDPLQRLATIIRAADTDRPELAPEAPGLLAAALGLSRMFSDDLEQLEAGMLLFDSFYRWARDATGETHNWPTNSPKR